MGDVMNRPALLARDAISWRLSAQALGQGMTEYALILSGVALLVIVALFTLGPQIGVLLNRVAASSGSPPPVVH